MTPQTIINNKYYSWICFFFDDFTNDKRINREPCVYYARIKIVGQPFLRFCNNNQKTKNPKKETNTERIRQTIVWIVRTVFEQRVNDGWFVVFCFAVVFVYEPRLQHWSNSDQLIQHAGCERCNTHSSTITMWRSRPRCRCRWLSVCWAVPMV